MAEVYPRVGGMKIERLIALHETVQGRLDSEVQKAFYKAEARKALHFETGNSYISISEGDIDRYLELNDPTTYQTNKQGRLVLRQSAALAIEMRHNIIRRAAGIK
jgi:hypothetical protein